MSKWYDDLPMSPPEPLAHSMIVSLPTAAKLKSATKHVQGPLTLHGMRIEPSDYIPDDVIILKDWKGRILKIIKLDPTPAAE